MFDLGVPGGADHGQGLQGLGFAGRRGGAETVGDGVRAPDLELVVVVPGGGHAVVQQGGFHLGLPPLRRVRMGEVEIGADLVPELNIGRLPVRVGDQQALGPRLLEQRVAAQQAGFDVGDKPHAGVSIGFYEAPRIRKPVAVPVEDVAFVADGGVAAGQVEAVAEDVVGLAGRQELAHAVLGVGGVGVAHGRAGIAEAPLWHVRRLAGQPGEPPCDLIHRRSGDEIVVEVSVIRGDVAIQAVVVVHLAAEVEIAVRQGVVEEAEGGARVRPGGDVEGDVLVEGVGAGGVIAHAVDVAQAKAGAAAVHGAGALAEAVVALAGIPAQVVVDALVPVAEVVGLGWPVARRRDPGVADPLFPGTEEAGEANGQADRGRLDPQDLIVLVQIKLGKGEAREVEPVSALRRHVVRSRRDRPGFRLAQSAVRQHQDAEDVVLEDEDVGRGAVVGRQRQLAGFGASKAKQRRIGETHAPTTN